MTPFLASAPVKVPPDIVNALLIDEVEAIDKVPSESTKGSMLVRLLIASDAEAPWVTVMPATSMTTLSAAVGTRLRSQLPGVSQSPLAALAQSMAASKVRSSINSQLGKKVLALPRFDRRRAISGLPIFRPTPLLPNRRCDDMRMILQQGEPNARWSARDVWLSSYSCNSPRKGYRSPAKLDESTSAELRDEPNRIMLSRLDLNLLRGIFGGDTVLRRRRPAAIEL